MEYYLADEVRDGWLRKEGPKSAMESFVGDARRSLVDLLLTAM